MARSRRGGNGRGQQNDLFFAAANPQPAVTMAAAEWPAPERFPVNHAQARLEDQVWNDLTTSGNPLLVSGFAEFGWRAVDGHGDRGVDRRGRGGGAEAAERPARGNGAVRECAAQLG